MLPQADDDTLIAYLLSASSAIHAQVNTGLAGDVAARLRESATVVARVAEQIAARRRASDGSALAEAHALRDEEAAFAAAEEARAARGLAAVPASARRIDVEALQSYLRRHPLGGDGLQVDEARLLPGGRCKLTAAVSVSGARDLPAVFILRQDWQGGATDTTVAHEFGLLARVSAGGLLAPRPLLLESRATDVGPPFILLERLPGALAGSLFTPPRSRRLGLQFAAQVGRLHSLDVAPFRDLVPQSADAATGLQARLQGLRDTHLGIGMRSRIVDAALDWLAANLAAAGEATAVTHNDLGFHNSLVQGEELTAILDWELASIAHPAADLGYVKPFVPRMLPWPEFVAAYEAAGGWRVEPATLRFHTIWSALRLYGLIMQARHALAQRLVDDVEITFACADNLMLLFASLARELQEADAL